MTRIESEDNRQTTPLALVVTGLVACALAEHLGFRDLVTIAVATNAAGLALLVQHRTQVTSKDERTADKVPEVMDKSPTALNED